jgi:hypothetical protein
MFVPAAALLLATAVLLFFADLGRFPAALVRRGKPACFVVRDRDGQQRAYV